MMVAKALANNAPKGISIDRSRQMALGKHDAQPGVIMIVWPMERDNKFMRGLVGLRKYRLKIVFIQ